jgi:hypothetical protein
LSRQIYIFLLLLGTGFILASCVIVRAPTAEELRALDQPPANVVTKVDKLLPRALEWYGRVEAKLLRQGRPLAATELAVARKLGVIHPERVRVVVLARFPMPDDKELRSEAERYGMGSSHEGGRTLGYAVMLKPRFAGNSTILIHELVHVSQHDRLGRKAFVRRYLVEMEMMGHARAPLELEAYQKQRSYR